jgi:hypothetical protein
MLHEEGDFRRADHATALCTRRRVVE